MRAALVPIFLFVFAATGRAVDSPDSPRDAVSESTAPGHANSTSPGVETTEHDVKGPIAAADTTVNAAADSNADDPGWWHDDSGSWQGEWDNDLNEWHDEWDNSDAWPWSGAERRSLSRACLVMGAVGAAFAAL